MQSALGFDVRGRARVARATPDDARLVLDDDAQISDLSSTLRRLAAQASTLAGAADALAVAHADDVGNEDLDDLRAAIAAAGLDAMVVPESIARTYAPDFEGDAQVAIGAARYALGREDRSGAIGGVAGGAAGGAAAGAAAGAAGRDTAAGEPSMSDFGDGRDMSQFGEGSQMSDFGDRSMSDFGEGRNMSEFGEGREMSEFGRPPQQPAATPPPPVAAPAPPPPAEPAKSKAKVVVAAAVVVAVIAVVAVVALASGGGDDTEVDTGASDTTAVEEDDDEPAAGGDTTDDTEAESPGAPSAGGPIAFSAGDGNSAQIFVSKGDGTDLRQVTQFGNEGNPGFQLTEVEWAPDGKTIYFVGARTDSEDGLPSLWSVNADGTNVRELTGVGKPAFSFDVGTDGRIVVLRGQVPAERTIAVFDASGGSEQVVTRGQIDLDPSWTPDGDIVFVRQSPEGAAIFSVKADGSGLQQLVSTFGFTSMPAVSPDGELLAWIGGASAEERTPALWVAKADGSEARVVEGFERSFESAGNPVWSKNSQFLLMTNSEGEVVLVDPASGDQTQLFSSPPPTTFMRYDILTSGAT